MLGVQTSWNPSSKHAREWYTIKLLLSLTAFYVIAHSFYYCNMCLTFENKNFIRKRCDVMLS